MSIRLIELTKRFGDTLVVGGVSLEIGEGELFTLLGGSGSGKSTILRLIAGLLHPDSGRIELNGRDVTSLPPQGRGTGFVFQNYSVFRHMTVAQNVEFGLRIRQVAPEQRRERRDELLELVGLVGLEERYADELSGGQQQRVALARALAYRPEVLLLDEPFGALDVKIRTQLRRSLREIQRHLNVTTILVTHDQEEAFEVADRVGVLDRGHLIEVGTPEDLYQRPQTEFVATFVGGGNVIVGREEAGRVRLGSVLLPMPEGAKDHDADAPVRVLFRPENVVLSEQQQKDGGAISLGRGRLVGRIFAGPIKRVVVEMKSLTGARPLSSPSGYGEHTPVIEALLLSDGTALSDPAPGQDVWVGLSGYHVLAPAGLKVLIAVDQPSEQEPAVAFGSLLAQMTGGMSRLLTVVRGEEAAAKAKESLEAMRQKWLQQTPHLDARVRQGDSTTEILLEAQEGLYEVVVIGQRTESGGEGAIGQTARRVLTEASLPVLVVQTSRQQIRRILICTAAGEPGKTDVRFGGRLARRTGAETTVLHVRPATTSQEASDRAGRHLGQAERFLSSIGVHSRISVRRGPLVETILDEAEQGDYDLVVIGAPAPQTRRRMLWRGFAPHILRATQRPVLVVPMKE